MNYSKDALEGPRSKQYTNNSILQGATIPCIDTVSQGRDFSHVYSRSQEQMANDLQVQTLGSNDISSDL